MSPEENSSIQKTFEDGSVPANQVYDSAIRLSLALTGDVMRSISTRDLPEAATARRAVAKTGCLTLAALDRLVSDCELEVGEYDYLGAEAQDALSELVMASNYIAMHMDNAPTYNADELNRLLVEGAPVAAIIQACVVRSTPVVAISKIKDSNLMPLIDAFHVQAQRSLDLIAILAEQSQVRGTPLVSNNKFDMHMRQVTTYLEPYAGKEHERIA